MQKLLFLLLAVFAISSTSFAQTREDQAEEDLDYYNQRPTEVFDDRNGDFWYGTGAQLGFSGGNNSSFFTIGITPIAGYKINNFLSVGPRGSVIYNRFRQDGFGSAADVEESFVTWAVGGFTRAIVFRSFFAHVEYSLVNEVLGFNNSTGEPVRTTRAIPFAGGGIQQGGGPGQVGFEILLLFRLTQADIIGDSPFEFRTGINYNF